MKLRLRGKLDILFNLYVFSDVFGSFRSRCLILSASGTSLFQSLERILGLTTL